MLHNNLECKSSLLCIAWAWAEISSITINTACLHGGTAQRGIYLQIHLSNTADVTDCVSSDDKCLLLDGHAAGHVHDGKKKKMEVWQRRAQTNSWMDGRMDSWWRSTLFTFLFVLFLSVCLSLLPFICSGAEKTRSFPTPKKRLFENTMQWRKLNSIKYFLVPRFKMNGGKFTAWAFIHFTSRRVCNDRDNASMFSWKEQRCASECSPMWPIMFQLCYGLVGMWMQPRKTKLLFVPPPSACRSSDRGKRDLARYCS